MQVPLQVSFEGGLESSSALQARIEREVAKLDKLSQRITACHVAITGRSHNRRHGDLFDVRIRMTVPGRAEIIVDRSPPADHRHEDAQVAIRDAFDAARRQLQEHQTRRSGKVKHHEGPPAGRIARLFPEEDHGFIAAADGQEIYFHRNAVANGGFDRLTVGQTVRFAWAEGDKGPQASTVTPVSEGRVLEEVDQQHRRL
ncbi:MAG TPA: HPF/RaiA family ribosome-associated protein [Caulobacteraceae bacterium]|nr:HPF/RaiA family ribosome-associated protein [Caulobacteraceae bacterium]